MKIEIFWPGAIRQILSGIGKDCNVVKAIMNGKIFDRVFNFEDNCGKNFCINFRHAYYVELRDEDN